MIIICWCFGGSPSDFSVTILNASYSEITTMSSMNYASGRFFNRLIPQFFFGIIVLGLGTAEDISADSVREGDDKQLSAKAEIRKRTDRYAESDRKAAQSHYDKLREKASAKGLSDLKQSGTKKSPSSEEPLAKSSSSTNAATASFSGQVLHDGPCTPCDIASEYPVPASSTPASSTPSVITPTPTVTTAAYESPIRSASPKSDVRKEVDGESTAKPSLPSQRSIQSAPSAGRFKSTEPLRIGSLKGLKPQEPDPIAHPVILPKVTYLPPPKISPIDKSSDSFVSNRTGYDSASLPTGRLASVTRNSTGNLLKPLRIGSLGSAYEDYDYTSRYTQESPSLLDQEAMASPSLSDSNALLDRSVQPAAFQAPSGFSVPGQVLPSTSGAQSFTTPAYPQAANSPGGLAPQPNYGVPSYNGGTVASGPPYVTPAPRQFDACYMVEPSYTNTNGNCGGPPVANTPTYSGLPGTVSPPTYMPNQVPQGLYPQANTGARPLFGLGQQNYNIQFGRGLFGQPKAYVPGQYVRNFFRYFTL